MNLYDQQTIRAARRPDTADGVYARSYLEPLVLFGPRHYVRNVHTDLRVLIADDTVLPLTVTRFHPQNSFVCSPYTHYFTYSLEEMDKLGIPAVEKAITAVLNQLRRAYRALDFDAVVLVNNWLLSTNLYPRLPAGLLPRAHRFLVDAFPDRPIVFRSVDRYGNPALADELAALGYQFVFSRNVYYAPWDAVRGKRDFKNDLRLYQQSPYRLREVTAAHLPRIRHLYNRLYLEKYSLLNPQFTAAFFQLAFHRKLLHFRAFFHPDRPEQPDAALGFFQRAGTMTQPIFGYDLDRPQHEGLYRLLSTQVALESRDRNLLAHNSAGVGRFKRNRGGTAVREYNAVFVDHLPYRTRTAWHVLRRILDRIAIPIIEEKEL